MYSLSERDAEIHMTDSKSARCVIVTHARACAAGTKNRKHLERQCVVISPSIEILSSTTDATLKFRDRAGELRVDPDAALYVRDDQLYLRSKPLAADLLARNLTQEILIIFIEQVQQIARVWLRVDTVDLFEKWELEEPERRLSAFGLPPTDSVLVSTGELVTAIIRRVAKLDRELISAQSDNFLGAPPILVPLVTHVAALTAEENLKFPVQLKRIADHFRQILRESASPIKIERILRNHLETWSEAQGRRYAFLDGGVARVLGLPGGEPTALRVGVYCVRAGDFSLQTRETWNLVPFVVGDIVDRAESPPIPDGWTTDVRRLAEAARYTLESLTGLNFADKYPDLATMFMHGPLVNQFTMYDEGEPNFIPYMDAEFLQKWNVTEEDIKRVFPDLPGAPGGGKMWRQFMAVYGLVVRRLNEHAVPVVGVVERSAGRWLAEAVLDGAIGAHLIKEGYKRKVIDLLKKYNISDDFLFGCVLEEGEYLTPVIIPKNNPRRAREQWQAVVAAYPHPHGTVLKTSASTFPFRIEMNVAAAKNSANVVRMIYHTARLLPRYAFPVGLDIVDRYAKVPDWLSRGVSAQLGGAVLRRAVAQGDAQLVVQVRQFLAHTPRDFFYRPTNI